WLAPVPGNKHKAYCKFCDKQFRAHRTDLRSHARSMKHQRAGDNYFSVKADEEAARLLTKFPRKLEVCISEASTSIKPVDCNDTIISEDMEDSNLDVEGSYIIVETPDFEEVEEGEEVDETTDGVSETEQNEYDLRETIIISEEETERSVNVKEGISTQVLDLVRGMPVVRLTITLFMECESAWTKICDGVTDEKGYCTLLKPEDIIQGRYKIYYDVKKYFTLGLHDTLYPFVEVTIDVSDVKDEYHVPLLLSPCGYMVYR
ncbi:hypothetical protein L9F63_024689, partial [Diploptera punctata]